MARKPKVEVVADRAETCKACRGSHFEGQEFTCRRHPATPVYNGMKGAIEFLHPIVAADHWCMDFLPILSS